MLNLTMSIARFKFHDKCFYVDLLPPDLTLSMIYSLMYSSTKGKKLLE